VVLDALDRFSQALTSDRRCVIAVVSSSFRPLVYIGMLELINGYSPRLHIWINLVSTLIERV
jgi:hypothetical protein